MEKLIIPSILSTAEVISMADRILKATQSFLRSDEKLATLHAKVTLLYERLVKNQKKISKSKLTEELFRSDKQRDRSFIALRNIIYGMSLNEETAGKANPLYTIIDKYGAQAYRLGYKAETAMLLSLFDEFNLPENQQRLTDLGILAFYQSLKTAQESFDLISKQKSDEKTTLDNESEAVSSVVQEMFPALINLVAWLQLYSQLNPETYGEIYNQIVTYVTEINTVARARRTRKKKDGEEQTEG
ncbi:MAG: hypothetical protein A2W90_03235 [Bacteroidetes bacterium GWF2_42_66]|nr:MAG: hypothetical protein A2W92_10630 [Bacteroidetes bacterium GWA2_42_15]OFY01349.1 MAG: hypothetical protein A2W89_16720 [Bacteroidetes bacterium GWE2_42_39]OFY42193.1 MAG: hypothetical protein A2W90_03235 [Bacteroidetes bacterium GWF2_42_66]HBL77592.1 hypothetical protein [Prolixibacteraceae bacterium]HCR89887.1 hypothetical protein [Prolixibacteraceae bacterium]